MAADMSPLSLDTLPIELLYRILDLLDNKTILFQFGHVCKQFYSIISTYNQYKLNFQSISKSSFHSICHRIRPENIVSLILSDDQRTADQIKLFLSCFSIEQFRRLHSLTLIQIDENDFQRIFQSNKNISSLSFTFRNNLLQNNKTFPLLSSIISNTRLRHLEFSLPSSKIENLSWPNQSYLQTLILSNRINFNQFVNILSHSFQLKKFVLQDCLIDEPIDIPSFPQLISLTFDDSELNIHECELILSLTPSLEHFHIVGGANLADGCRWEQLIQMKLLKLKQFQFAFCGNTDILFEESSINVELLIQSFRTSFWMEIKQWFVVCYYFKETNNYSLYSLPICKSNVRFYPYKDKISCSTYRDVNGDRTITDNVQEMQLNLTNLMAVDDEKTSPVYPYFRKLNKLLLCVTDEWPAGSIEHLLTFIDFSCIVELSISIDFEPTSVSNNTLENLIDFFQRTPHLHTLTIDSSSATVENICLIVPNYVKHLQVSVKRIDDMKMIIEQLKYLSSITFEHFNGLKHLSTEFLPWLMENRRTSTCRIDEIFVSIWFEKIGPYIN